MMLRANNPIKIFFILLVMPFFARDAYSQSLEAQFIGNEAFRITDGKFFLMTDFPYKSGAYNYMKYKFDFSSTTGTVLSLITHRHDDHFAPVLFANQAWYILGPAEVTAGLPQSRLLPFSEKVTFEPLTIWPKKSTHGNTEHYSYLVDWSGRKLFFTGDTEDLVVLKDLPELDALFITPWFYRKAKLNEALPESKKIIIYHHMEKDIVPECPGCIIPVQNDYIEID
ncbi:MAG: hypothetical protein L3J50_05435 [Emcibacter sp.]|nr:hypothetical protein [Emcibacter sp.]